MMPHVFVSYAHVDGDFVTLLRSQIDKTGIEVWLDFERLKAGDDWRQGIDNALVEAFAIIAVMSPEAVESRYVTYEWSLALGMGKTVVPLMLRKTELHPRLRTLQYISCTNHLKLPFRKINTRLQQIQRAYQPQTVALPPCPDNIAPLLWRHIAALHDKKAHVRKGAAAALAESGDCSAAPALAAALRAEKSSLAVRIAIIDALGKIGDARAVPALLAGLRDKSRLARTKRICDYAAIALEQIGSTEALTAVQRWKDGGA